MRAVVVQGLKMESTQNNQPTTPKEEQNEKNINGDTQQKKVKELREEIRNEILKRDIKRRRQEFEAGGPSSTHVLLPLTLIPGWPTWQAKRDQMIQAAQMNQVIPHPPIAHTPSVLPPAFEPWIP